MLKKQNRIPRINQITDTSPEYGLPRVRATPDTPNSMLTNRTKKTVNIFDGSIMVPESEFP
jgi:hypothetical protein